MNEPLHESDPKYDGCKWCGHYNSRVDQSRCQYCDLESHHSRNTTNYKRLGEKNAENKENP